ncbi:hypothetical protein BJV38_002035 [Clostridium beijerinckii]|uniref:hypothetical protein n=1 Tax=Clostridium beijerinckii TaxID=1520 RepID=UPI001570516D|nr:hypothetical protein [Clostridium beijerinckii]NRT35379.1 hypothetical protein [Clostridium beijerinckii]NRT45192.1 hypothetical protein [Clostridium beijerinckii]NRZ20811.1 hypothetical protein [Clostridium beijerinckii]
MLKNMDAFSFLEEYDIEDIEIAFLLEYTPALKLGINLTLIYKENDKGDREYFIIYRHFWGKVKKRYISDSDGKIINKLLENGKVSIIPPEKHGLDGYSYTFTFINNMNFAQYSWWGEPEEKWGVFGELVKVIFKYIDMGI